MNSENIKKVTNQAIEQLVEALNVRLRLLVTASFAIPILLMGQFILFVRPKHR
jgi:hypothetical protein